MRRARVDFPEPLAPRIAKISPSAILVMVTIEILVLLGMLVAAMAAAITQSSAVRDEGIGLEISQAAPHIMAGYIRPVVSISSGRRCRTSSASGAPCAASWPTP